MTADVQLSSTQNSYIHAPMALKAIITIVASVLFYKAITADKQCFPLLWRISNMSVINNFCSEHLVLWQVLGVAWVYLM